VASHIYAGRQQLLRTLCGLARYGKRGRYPRIGPLHFPMLRLANFQTASGLIRPVPRSRTGTLSQAIMNGPFRISAVVPFHRPYAGVGFVLCIEEPARLDSRLKLGSPLKRRQQAMRAHETIAVQPSGGFCCALRSTVSRRSIFGALRMSINSNFGRFCLDAWENPDREDIDAQSEYSDNLQELQDRAEVILSAGRFKYIQLSRWIGPSDEDWEPIGPPLISK